MYHYKPKKTFTEIMVTAMVVLVPLILLVFGGLRCTAGCSGADRRAASDEATRWSQQMGIQPLVVDCVGMDTDGDGYLSCTVSYRKPDGAIVVQPLECATKWTWNSGCRVPKMGMLRQ